MKSIIGGLSVASKEEQSEALFQKLIKHERYRAANKLSIYLSTENEVDTKRILQHTLETVKKQCYIPFVRKMQLQSGLSGTRMIMVRLTSMREFEELPLNHYGIKEPSGDLDNEKIAIPSETDLDLIIVPGVAFNLAGHRLGHGKGYYDEFLKDWQQKAPKPVYSIGLAFREQIHDDIPVVSGHDFVLDEILEV